MSGFAWVTLATNDSYSLGALVLAHSLKQVSTAHQLAVLVTPGVTNVMRKNLADVFNVVEEVNLFDSKDEANLRLLKRPELGVTFTKLHCWRLTQFEKCVFLDADVLVLANSDELFEREEFSASPDVGWPDCFNSGVFVYRPSLETYTKLVDFAIQRGSFDGGDQGLLNAYFSDWAHKDISKHLPFIYNMCSTACYSYLPAFKYYGANVKIVHFIGPAKPWLQYFDTESRKVHPSPDLQHLQEVLQKWWDMFCSLIHPKLSPDMSGLAGAFAQFILGEKRSPSQDALENHLRRQAWEVGNIDYMGRDSFDNIWSKICQTLSTTQLQTPDKDGAVSSSETQQIPEVKDKQQVETATVAENQEISENTAVVKTPSSEISTSIAVAEEKPKEVKDDAPKAIVQEDEVKPEDNIQKTQEIVPPKEIVTEVSKTDDRPQDAGASAEEIKSDIPVVEKTAEISETPGIPKSDGEQKKENVISQEVKTDIPEAAVESPKVEDQQVVQPDIIPENEPVQETTVPKEEAKLETSVKVDESISVETVTPKEESKLDETKIELPENVEKSATVVTQCSEVGSQVSEQIESPKAAESSEQVEESIPETQESKLEDIKPDVVSSTEVKQESEISRTEILPTEAQPPASDAITSQDIAKLEESKPDVIATAEPQQEIVASLEKEIPPSDTKLEGTKSTEDLPASKEEVAEVVECRIRDPAAISIPDTLSTQPEEPEKADVTEDTKPDIITEASKEEVVEKKTTEEIASKTSIIQEQPEEPTIVQKEAEPEVIEPSSIKLETSTEEIVETQKEIEPPIAETSPIKLEPLTEKNTETIKDTGAEIAGASPNKSEPLTEKIVEVEKETEPNIAETCPIKLEPSTEKTSKIQKGTKPKTTTASLMKSESSTEKMVETQKDSESETTQTSPITSEPQKSKTVVTRKIPKEKVAPTSQVPPESPKEAKPISPTEPKVTKVVKKVKPKADSTAEAGKVQPKLEPPIEAPKSQETPKTEAATPLESVQAELSAEGSADVPKSDTKPKVKKIKKVKKVVKPAEPATESTDTPETAGASKK